MMPQLLIFDFDGVLADSETLANQVLAEAVTELGHPTTLSDSFRIYMGKRFHDVIAAVEKTVGHPVPLDFGEAMERRTLQRFEQELKMIEGARDYIETFAALPRCIASSSSPDRLELCLRVLGLTDLFGSNVFSADQVERGKPHPDIFLHAAQKMGVDPSRALIIEDSIGGVTAGVAAGATVIGLLAGSHIQDGHAARLRGAGAHHVARDFAEVTEITRALLAA